MAGNKIGGAKSAAKNKALYGDNYYHLLGKLGGSAPKSTPAGFAADRDRAAQAGRKGGLTSRRNRGY